METSRNNGWQYKVVKLGPSSSETCEVMLNHLGADGWELVSFQPLSPWPTLLREKLVSGAGRRVEWQGRGKKIEGEQVGQGAGRFDRAFSASTEVACGSTTRCMLVWHRFRPKQQRLGRC